MEGGYIGPLAKEEVEEVLHHLSLPSLFLLSFVNRSLKKLVLPRLFEKENKIEKFHINKNRAKGKRKGKGREDEERGASALEEIEGKISSESDLNETQRKRRRMNNKEEEERKGKALVEISDALFAYFVEENQVNLLEWFFEEFVPLRKRRQFQEVYRGNLRPTKVSTIQFLEKIGVTKWKDRAFHDAAKLNLVDVMNYLLHGHDKEKEKGNEDKEEEEEEENEKREELRISGENAAKDAAQSGALEALQFVLKEFEVDPVKVRCPIPLLFRLFCIHLLI